MDIFNVSDKACIKFYLITSITQPHTQFLCIHNGVLMLHSLLTTRGNTAET